MADYCIHFSAEFDPGAGNVEKALKIYQDMQASNDGYLCVTVKKDNDRLSIHHHSDGQGDVVGHAVAFVSECARRLKLAGTWSAAWTNGYGEFAGVMAVDLATQARVFIDREYILDFAKRMVGSVADQKADFPNEVRVRKNRSFCTGWLTENVGDRWRSFTRNLGVDGVYVDEEVAVDCH